MAPATNAVAVYAPDDNGLSSTAKKRLSIASSVLDTEGKGYLDEVETLCRKYDRNGDGTFSATEVKNIVRDVQEAQKTARNLTRLLVVVVVLAVGVCATLLGLMFAANEVSKENHTSQSGELVTLAGGAVKTAPVESFGDMREFLELDFATLAKLNHVTFTTGTCTSAAHTTNHFLRVGRFERSGAAGGTMRLFGSDGAGVVTITGDAITFEGGALAAQEAVCLGAAPTGGGRRRLMSEAERRQLSLMGSLMTSGSFTMMSSAGGG